MAEEDPPEREVKDFQFRSAAKIRVQPSVDTIPGERLSLLAVSSKHGLIFVGDSQGFKVFQSSEITNTSVDAGSKSFVEDCSDWSTVKTLAPPTHLAVSVDSLTLAVCSKRYGFVFADMYDIRAFANQKAGPAPFLQVKLSLTAASELTDFCWNPGQDFTSLCTVCLSDGSVAVYQITDQLKIVASVTKGIDAKCLCWSPKGKQLVVGKSDGSLAQYDQGLSKKKDIACPDVFDGKPMTAIDLLWESTHVFLVAYEPQDNSDREQPSIVMVTSSKEGKVSYIPFEDPCFGGGEERAHKVFMNIIPDWDIIVISSANALEAAVLGRQEQNKAAWERWNLDDTARAELPLREDHSETYPAGMAIDYSCQRDIPLGDNRVHAPAPILMLLSTDGALITFHMMNSRPGAKLLTVAPQALGAQGQRKPLGTPTQDPNTQLPPSKGDSTPAARSLFPAPTFKDPAATSTAAPAAVAKSNLFGSLGKSLTLGNQSINLGQPLSQSTPQPGAGTRPSTKPPISQGSPLSQPVFGDPANSSASGTTATKPVLGGASGFQLGSKTDGDSRGAQGFTFAGQSSQGTSKAAEQTAVTLESTSGQGISVIGSKASSQSGGLFSTVSAASGKHPASSGSSGFGSLLGGKPTATPSPLAQQSNTAPQQPTQQPVQQKAKAQQPASPQQQQQPQSKPHSVAEFAALSPKPAATSSPYQHPQSPRPASVEVAHHRPQPVQPSVPAHETPGRQTPTQASGSHRGQDPFAKAIVEEVAKFERELAALLSADLSIDIGSKAELQDLGRGTEEMRRFLGNVREATQSVNSDIHDLKGQCLDSFAMLEECRLRAEKSRTGNNKHQPLRGLDPVSERQMREIRACYQQVDSAVGDVDLKLDTQWEAYQNSKNKRRMQAPVTDTIYRTLNANQKVMGEQSQALEHLCWQLKDVRMYNLQSDWGDTPQQTGWGEAPRRVGSLGDTPTQSRRSTSDSVNGTLDHSDLNLSFGGMSPQKNAKLRDFLGNRHVTPIKCKNTSVDLSQSVLVQSAERPPRPHRPAPSPGAPATPTPVSLAAAAAGFWGSPAMRSPGRMATAGRSPRSPLAQAGPPAHTRQSLLSGQQALASLLSGGQQIGGALASAMFGADEGEKTESLGCSTAGFGQGQGQAFGRTPDTFPAPGSPPKHSALAPSGPKQKSSLPATQAFSFTTPSSSPSPSFNFGKPTPGMSTGFSFGGATSLDKVTFGAVSSGATTGFNFSDTAATKAVPMATSAAKSSRTEVTMAKTDQPPLPFITQPESLVTKPTLSGQFTEAAALSKDRTSTSRAPVPSQSAFIPKDNTAAAKASTTMADPKSSFVSGFPSTAPSPTGSEASGAPTFSFGAEASDKDVGTQGISVKGSTPDNKPSSFVTGFNFKPTSQTADSTSNTGKAASFSFAKANQDNANKSEDTKASDTVSSTIPGGPDSRVGKRSNFSFEEANQKSEDKDTAAASFASSFSFTAPTPGGSAAGGSVFGGGSQVAAPQGSSVFSGLGNSSLFGQLTTATQGGAPVAKVTAEADSTKETSNSAAEKPQMKAPPTYSSLSSAGVLSSSDASKPQQASSTPPAVDNSVTSSTEAAGSAPTTASSTPGTSVALATTPAGSASSSTAAIFGQTTGSVFGQAATSSAATSSIFGQAAGTPSIFGQPVTSTNAVAPIGQTNVRAGTTGTPTPASGFSFGAAASTNAGTTTSSSIFGQPVSNTTMASTTTTTTTSVFGQQATSGTTASVFGLQSSGSIFGQPTTSTQASTFGQATATMAAIAPDSSLFGQSTSSGSVFGQPASFGATTLSGTSAPSPFGQTTTVTTAAATQGVFGQSATSTAGFGQTGSKLFGTVPQTSQVSVFGGTSGAVGSSAVFGSSVTPQTCQSSVFGATSPAGGGGIFGDSQPQTGGVFGGETQAATGTGFGSSQAGGSMFGQPSATPVKSDSAVTFGGGGLFGGLGGKPSAENANKNVFGGSATFGTGAQETSSLFGSGQTTSVFGSAQTTNSSGSFSGAANATGSGFGGFQQAAATPKSAAGFGTAQAFGSSPAFTGSPAFAGGAGFGGGATFSSPFGGGTPTADGAGGGLFGADAAASPQQAAGFSGFANAGSPTFGALAQTGGSSGFGAGGFGGQGQGFAQPQSPGGTSFTSYRS